MLARGTVAREVTERRHLRTGRGVGEREEAPIPLLAAAEGVGAALLGEPSGDDHLLARGRRRHCCFRGSDRQAGTLNSPLGGPAAGRNARVPDRPLARGFACVNFASRRAVYRASRGTGAGCCEGLAEAAARIWPDHQASVGSRDFEIEHTALARGALRASRRSLGDARLTRGASLGRHPERWRRWTWTRRRRPAGYPPPPFPTSSTRASTTSRGPRRTRAALSPRTRRRSEMRFSRDVGHSATAATRAPSPPLRAPEAATARAREAAAAAREQGTKRQRVWTADGLRVLAPPPRPDAAARHRADPSVPPPPDSRRLEDHLGWETSHATASSSRIGRRGKRGVRTHRAGVERFCRVLLSWSVRALTDAPSDPPRWAFPASPRASTDTTTPRTITACRKRSRWKRRAPP